MKNGIIVSIICALMIIFIKSACSISLVKKPSNITVNMGQNITLYCKANTETTYYSWSFIPYNSPSFSLATTIGYCYKHKDCVNRVKQLNLLFTNESRVTIVNSTSKHSGKYICETVAAKNFQMITSSAFIFVRTPPNRITIKFNKTKNVFQEHEYVSIYCHAFGSNPRPVIQMFINYKTDQSGYKMKLNVMVDKVNSHSIRIYTVWRPVYNHNQGFVTCEASNEAGQLTEKSLPLNIRFEPKMQKNLPSVIKARENQTLDILCSVIANPIASIAWIIGNNKQRIESAEFVTIVQRQMDGYLTCSANNSIGSRSKTIKLKVLYDPEIHLLKHYTTKEDSALSIVCKVSAAPTPHITKWYKVLEDGTSAQCIDTSGTLYFPGIKKSDAGKYRCEAINKQETTFHGIHIGRRDKTIDIIVTYKPGPPKIISQKIISIKKGSPFELKCTFNSTNEGIPKPELQWFHQESQSVVSKSSAYSVLSSQLSQNGNYKCLAVNIFGKVQSQDTIKVEINEAPLFVVEDDRISSHKFVNDPNMSKSIQFSCGFSGYPSPNIQWFYASPHNINRFEPITNQPRYSIIINNSLPPDLHISDLTRSILTVNLHDLPDHNDIKLHPNGKYRCVASNSYGIASYDYFLIIKYPPKIRSSRHNRKIGVVVGQSSVIIQCVVESVYNSIRVVWQHDQQSELILSKQSISKYSIITKNKSSYQPSDSLFQAGVTISQLTIFNVQSADIANYSCIAANELGRTKQTFQIVLKSKPDPPLNLSIKDFTWDSITLNWEAGFNGGLDQNFQIQVESKLFGRQVVPYYSSNPFNTLTITGLHPSTNYSISIFSENIMGNSESSKNIFCQTKDYNKFKFTSAKILSDQQMVLVVLPINDLCVNLDYLRNSDTSNYPSSDHFNWIGLYNCAKYNNLNQSKNYRDALTSMMDYNKSISITLKSFSLSVDKAASSIDIESGTVKFRISFCVINRPSVCSQPQILKNQSGRIIMTQTLILIIAGFCIMLILVLTILFVVCCLHLNCSCKFYEMCNNNSVQHQLYLQSHTNDSTTVTTTHRSSCRVLCCCCRKLCNRSRFNRNINSPIINPSKFSEGFESNQFIHHNKHNMYQSTHSHEEDENNNHSIGAICNNTLLTQCAKSPDGSLGRNKRNMVYSSQQNLLLTQRNHAFLSANVQTSNHNSSSFICGHQMDNIQRSDDQLFIPSSIYSGQNLFCQTPSTRFQNSIHNSILNHIPFGAVGQMNPLQSASSCEASSSYSQHSSQGSSSIQGSSGTGTVINRVKFRPKHDAISLNSLTKNNSQNTIVNNNENIQMPDVTTEAIQYMRPDPSDNLSEVRV